MISLDGNTLTLEHLAAVARGREEAGFDEAARERVLASRAVIERIIAEDRTVYGVNTGFGKLADVRIAPDHIRELQVNLLRSHACGVGEPLSEAETRAMICLRANVLAKGFSGVRPVVIETLLEMLNRGVHPIIPSRGSVGASGDLAPLAHLALVAIGEGEAIYQNERMSGGAALRRAGIAPLELQAREGVALINGTQAMCAVGALALLDAEKLAATTDVAGAMTLEALRGTPAAFRSVIHEVRPQRGQLAVARHLLALLAESEIRESHRNNDPRVQDAYSLRCMPQVHGASRDTLSELRRVLEIEINSATDNPLVFPGKSPELDEVISGGNFHGEPVAMALDYAAIGVAELGAISERRIERLVNPDLSGGLPPFLVEDAGTNSGMMIAQVTAVALCAENKILAHPASTDSLPTSGNREDHVSMGMTSALKLRQIVRNTEQIVAIELICAAQGLEYLKPLRPGRGVELAYQRLRHLVAPLVEDRALAPDLAIIAGAVNAGAFDLKFES
ncbi:MAG TPA: histidine ammonia-lyase [Blastocatellia bacterium]|nr:histidine ammonia-lyase [Blastocatellia bacterium]